MQRSKTLQSSPIATGGLGYVFENNVKTAFISLMLIEAIPPISYSGRIEKINFQTNSLGYHTDDMLITISDENQIESKLICSIKMNISFTNSNKEFQEVFQSAWKDYHNKKLCSQNDKLCTCYRFA